MGKISFLDPTLDPNESSCLHFCYGKNEFLVPGSWFLVPVPPFLLVLRVGYLIDGKIGHASVDEKRLVDVVLGVDPLPPFDGLGEGKM